MGPCTTRRTPALGPGPFPTNGLLIRIPPNHRGGILVRNVHEKRYRRVAHDYSAVFVHDTDLLAVRCPLRMVDRSDLSYAVESARGVACS
eukprot:1354232-Amorphochlora_amoeboformis.AAC.1